MADVIYVYGLVRRGFDGQRVPAGLDDADVTVLESAGFHALASRLSDDDYSATTVSEKSGDLTWLSPRALAHDRVLTWAQEHGGVIPFPMFSLFSGQAALDASLHERAEALHRAFARVRDADEFGVRAHRRDSVMLQVIDQLDDSIGRLRADAAGASPGQRYLLDRKIAEQSKAALRSAGQRIAREVLERLKTHSRAAVSRPLVPDADRANEATMVLNGAFLVDHASTTDFRGAVSEVIREFEPKGITFEFTGPWPPYNFVSGDAT